MEFVHVDVFARTPYSGNSLPVFPDARGLSDQQMLRIAQELRHFETIFLDTVTEPGAVRARVFDLREELPFAGHPLIGAAAVLHHESHETAARSWRFVLPGRTVEVLTHRTADAYSGLLEQGRPSFLGGVADRRGVAAAFGLAESDIAVALPLEVVDAGLSYLVVPVTTGALARARIVRDITHLLRPLGAQFAVVLDGDVFEIRHWNNDGVLEDIATGSAAGAVGAYLMRHGLVSEEQQFALSQGRFVGRPSQLRLKVSGRPDDVTNVFVGGDVAIVGRGVLTILP